MTTLPGHKINDTVHCYCQYSITITITHSISHTYNKHYKCITMTNYHCYHYYSITNVLHKPQAYCNDYTVTVMAVTHTISVSSLKCYLGLHNIIQHSSTLIIT